MDPVILLLRLLHIVLGVFWAGTIFFFTVFLLPSLGDIGPDAGKVMGALQKRRYVDIMPIVAMVTIFSGLLMYIRFAAADPSYMKSVHGMGYGVGGLSAIFALGVGMSMIRPAANRLGEIMAKMPAMPAGTERDTLMAEVQKLRQRTTTGSRVVAALLLLTVILMALTRYL